MKFGLIISHIIITMIIFSSFLFANNSTFNNVVVGNINVTVKMKPSTIGTTFLDTEYIQGAPLPTKTISDLLRGSSYVQFDQTSRNSFSGGEITPPKVSIRGSKYYENSFLIDGVSNNNNMNPAGFSIETDTQSRQPSGDPQTLFIDPSIVDSVTIYTQNIPAQFGGFTGGVVDAKLREAKRDGWHATMNFRYTNDSWAKFNWTKWQKRNLNTTSTAKIQPRFTKYNYNIALDGPLAPNLGLMISYGKKMSKIPLGADYYIQDDNAVANIRARRNQYRKNENFLFKFNTVDIDDLKISLTGIYAPYEQIMNIPTFKNSDYSIKGGGYTAILDIENILSFGSVKNRLNFQQNILSRISNTDVANEWKYTPNGYANWLSIRGLTSEGAFGDYKQSKIDIGYSGSLELDRFNTFMIEHTFKIGAEVDWAQARARQGGYKSFQGSVLDPTAKGEKKDGILEGEQYSKKKYEVFSEAREKSVFSGSIFLEDKIEFDRFKIVPGLRVSTDNIAKNYDLAWRLFANADIFNNKLLNLYGGFNRYFGSQILSYALYIPGSSQNFYRDSWDAPWVARPSSTYLMFGQLGDLKTPYSDEMNVGISVDLYDTLFEADFVTKKYKAQIRSKVIKHSDGTRHDEFKNSGSSSYWGLSLALSKEYNLGFAGQHISKLSATRSSSKSNSHNPFASFQDYVDADRTSYQYVYYNDALIAAEDLPATNFNNPWVIAYTHTAKIHDNIKLFTVARYSAGGSGIRQFNMLVGPIAPDGLETKVYKTKYYRDTFNVDLSGEFNFKIKGNSFIVGVDVLNIFSKKNKLDIIAPQSGTNSFSMGRQFFANFKYRY